MASNVHKGDDEALEVGCHETVYVGIRSCTLDSLAEYQKELSEQERKTYGTINWLPLCVPDDDPHWSRALL